MIASKKRAIGVAVLFSLDSLPLHQETRRILRGARTTQEAAERLRVFAEAVSDSLHLIDANSAAYRKVLNRRSLEATDWLDVVRLLRERFMRPDPFAWPN